MHANRRKRESVAQGQVEEGHAVMDRSVLPVSKHGNEPRYRVGCAGMFVLGMDYGMDDPDEAIIAANEGPPGCEVYDTVARKWIGPGHPDDVDDARERLLRRSQHAG